MKFPSQKPLIKLFLFTSIILLFVGWLYFTVSIEKKNTSETMTEFHLLLSATPTPYPLPTKVYDQPSYLTTILGWIFGNKNKLANPSEIEQNAQKRLGNEQIDLYVQNDHLAIDSEWWQQESKQVYEYVRHRLDITIDEKVTVIFVPPQTGNCAPRGTTFHEQQPVIFIFVNQGTSKDQILATLAHELGHVFIHNKYENLSDVALSEGMATWAAGDYWKAWKGVDFNTAVMSYITNKTYLPLFQNYDIKKAFDDVPDCIRNRDILLTEFASFIDYLIQSRSLEQLSALFNVHQPELMNNQQIVYPPNFKSVYGFELNQLEQEWLRALLYNE
jgi:hypothetical protein